MSRVTGPQDYRTPRSFRNALILQSRELARQRGWSMEHVRDWFFFQRLAARVFEHDPNGWLILGGQALLIRYQGQSRMSRDIDLQYAPASGLEEAYSALAQAASRDLNDFLSFGVPPSLSDVDPDHATQPVGVEVSIAGTPITHIKVDLTAGTRYTDPPAVSELRPELPLLQEGVPWPRVRLAPALGHVCDKICAMYTRYGANRVPSTRVRDLVDVLLMCQQEVFEGPELYSTLTQEVRRRQERGHEVVLPSQFHIPNPTWERSYPEQARQVRGLQGCGTLAEARVVAARFLDPVLGSCARERPLTGKWSVEAGWHGP
ncbi:nucleotidyl transferase AbiEii/AbiGii toxin family protein [Nocardiopsis dassonvillei]|uniref:nucleotidyl transferase AbiEii/AbiGii toxin family protein n=1 Tax=Nocardiopsis dassonvillei TaxID=2014 RepID=UPI0033ED3C83